MLFRVPDQGGDVVSGEERVGEDLGLRERQVGDGGGAEVDLLQVG